MTDIPTKSQDWRMAATPALGIGGYQCQWGVAAVAEDFGDGWAREESRSDKCSSPMVQYPQRALSTKALDALAVLPQHANTRSILCPVVVPTARYNPISHVLQL